MASTKEGAIESAQQLWGMWKALVESAGATAFVEEGVAHLWADSPFPWNNALTFTDPDVDGDELQRRLDHAARFMRGQERPGYLWLFQELLTDAARAELDDRAGRAGLAYSSTCYGMAGDVLPFAEPTHADLRFERVASQDHLGAYAGLIAHAYDMPEADVRPAFLGSRLWLEDIHAYLGFEGDLPVCCGGAYPVDGRLFVIQIATDADWRGRGYGEAVTRKALYEAAKVTGLRRATLHATEAGRPLYERIGLGVTSIMPIYAPA